ncbi:MAG: HEAT repeat domain-containing protein [Planctomycetes bacterium]|nr:HEAT repeat domain-containing protein [Planctomycetota bacterium]
MHWIGLALVLAISSVVPLRAQEEIGAWIERWESGAWEERERASREILDRWQEWRPTDLEKLDSVAREHPELEVRERAEKTLRLLRIRRAIGPGLVSWGLDRNLLAGTPEARSRALVDAAHWWLAGRVRSADLVPLVRLAMAEGWDLPTRDLSYPFWPSPPVPYAPLFARDLDSDDPETRKMCGEILGRMPGSFSNPDSFALLASPGTEARSIFLRSLAPQEIREHAAEIVACLRDPVPRVRRSAIETLVRADRRESAASIAELIEDPDPGVRRDAVSALERLEANECLPRIAERLQDSDSSVQQEALDAVVQLGGKEHANEIRHVLAIGRYDLRREAVRALARLLGPEAVPDLRGLLGNWDDDLRLAALLELARLVPDSILEDLDAACAEESDRYERPWHLKRIAECLAQSGTAALLPLVRSQNPGDRVVAAGWLGKSNPTKAAQRLVALLSDPDPNVRRAALAAIGQLDLFEHAGDVAKHLADSEPEVRFVAALVLSALDARDQASEVENLLADPDRAVRSAATVALARLGGTRALAAILRDGDEAEKEVAARAVLHVDARELYPPALRVLARTHEDPRRLVPGDRWFHPYLGPENRGGVSVEENLALIEESNSNVAKWAVESLASLGAPEAVPRLATLVDHADWGVRALAIEALGRLQAHEFSDLVAGKLTDPEHVVRNYAIHALQAMGSREHAGRIASLLGDPDSYVQMAAIGVLVDFRATEYASRIAECLGDEDDPVRGAAAAALADLDARDLAPRLVPLIRDRSNRARGAALLAYSRIGGEDRLDEIAEALKDPEESVRFAAFDAFVRIDPERTEVLALVLLGDSSAKTRLDALRLVLRLDPRKHLGCIAPLRFDLSPEVRDLAIEALGRYGSKWEASLLLPLIDAERGAGSIPAAKALAEADPEGSRPAITPLLRHPYPGVRAHAIRELRSVGTPWLAEEVRPALWDQAPEVRLAAIEALSTCGADDDAERIAVLLGDADPSVVQGACLALSSIEGSWNVELAWPLLSHADRGARARAISLLGGSRDPSSALRIGRVLTEIMERSRSGEADGCDMYSYEDPDCATLRALGELRAVESSDSIAGFLDAEMGHEREALEALGKMGSRTHARRVAGWIRNMGPRNSKWLSNRSSGRNDREMAVLAATALAEMGAREHAERIERLLRLLLRSSRWQWDPWVEMEWLGTESFDWYFQEEQGGFFLDEVPQHRPEDMGGGWCGTGAGHEEYDIERDEREACLALADALRRLGATEAVELIARVGEPDDPYDRSPLEVARTLADLGARDRARAIVRRREKSAIDGIEDYIWVQLALRLDIPLPREMVEALSKGRYGRGWPILPIGEAASRSTSTEERPLLLSALSRAAESGDEGDRIQAKIALARAGVLDREEILSLIDQVAGFRSRNWFGWLAEALGDALLERFEPDIHRSYRTDVLIEDRIEDAQDLGAFLAKAGLPAEVSEELVAESMVCPGLHVSPRTVVEGFGGVLFADRAGGSVLAPRTALSAWRARVESDR